MNSVDAQLAARLANGESLSSVLRHVRELAWDEGWDAAYRMAEGWGHVDGWENPWPRNPHTETQVEDPT